MGVVERVEGQDKAGHLGCDREALPQFLTAQAGLVGYRDEVATQWIDASWITARRDFGAIEDQVEIISVTGVVDGPAGQAA